MPRLVHRFPTLRPKKVGTKQYAVVTLDGRDIYCGDHGAKAAKVEYDRVIADWLANGRRSPQTNGHAPPTVNQVILAYWKHATAYYRRADGTPTDEQANIRKAMRVLREHCGHTRATDFGPVSLQAVRQRMIDKGWARGWINRNVDRIKRMFKWAASQELLPTAVYEGLRTVDGLRNGRSGAKETEPVQPVPEASVDAAMPYVRPQIATMVRLQLLTGMRPGEVIVMRPCDLDTNGAVWRYIPESHKTVHRGHHRVIFLGPQAQEILKPWLSRDPDAYLFSPNEAKETYQAGRRRNRKTPMTPSQVKRQRKRNPKRAPRERYTVNSYRYAITKACRRAGVPKWFPHQLRHNAATRIEQEHSVEVARIILGHRHASVTEAVYIERDGSVAAKVMQEMG